MFEVTVYTRFYDHRAHLGIPSHILTSTLHVKEKKDISKEVEQLLTTTCTKLNPKITNIQIHKGYEQHIGKFSNLFKKDPYDFTNTSDCAVLQKWNANLAKCLTYAVSGGVDSKTREQCGPKYRAVEGDVLTYEEFMPRFMDMMDWLAGVYVKTLNLIHYMHDKYFYEAAELALIDTDVRRTFATGIAGFSHVVDSISAIKYAKVNIVRDETGFPLSFKTEGDFPRYGNDDERADEIAVWLLKTFMNMIKKHHTYRNSEPTTSILTITSNVVYGKFTSNMPDGRPAGAPLAPGANPSYGAEKNGLLASLNSVAKLPYEYALDGISNTQTISPGALGHNDEERAQTLVGVLDGYFNQGSHHLNVNVFGIDKLKDAMEHPEKEEYQNFTIRVSGYAVKFIDLTREQQLDVIARQAHERL